MKDTSRDKPFLGVSSSVSGQRWMERLDGVGRNTALAIAQASGLPDLVARVLAGRGVSAEDAERFLDPTIRDLMPDPSVLTGMDSLAERLARAIRAGERIAIFGDYDVDGAASSALLARFLDFHGTEHEIYIPDRIFEGYGPNPEAIRELAERGARLLVTVDCGSTSFAALAQASELGLDTLILDHHQMDETGPSVVALVNPNRQDDLSGLGHLCAAGVVFMALVATTRQLRNAGHYEKIPAPDLLAWLDLVALATVCDVVPLRGLNRAFVVRGLLAMHRRANLGLAALSDGARLDGPARPWHLGFVLGPRINAGGRIGDAALGARLLTSNDPSQAAEIAATLERLNAERQAQEARMLEEAVAEAEAEIGSGDGPPVLLVHNAGWHPGIVGLIASRLKERFRRPAFAIAFDGMGSGSGSGRSISGVDIGLAVRKAVTQGILIKGGGHTMAAGLTVKRERLSDLREFLETELAGSVKEASDNHVLKIDGALSARSVTVELHDMLEKAGPYGQGHPSPVFVLPSHTPYRSRIVGRDHVSLTLKAGDGASIQAIAFRAVDTPLGALLLRQGEPIHVVGTISADMWQGTRRVQFRIMDAARPPAFV
ncbi:MAG: single-stranded-DNA-specific exonuclease RecJ [Rhizobiaceae bacterium]